jgi:hypothetical protein
MPGEGTETVTRTMTRNLMGDPAPGRTPWAAPAEQPNTISRSAAPPRAEMLTSAGAPLQQHGASQAGETEGQPLAPAPAEDQPAKAVSDIAYSPGASALRPVQALCASTLDLQPIPTEEPIVDWMAPTDLLIEGAYQRDLSDKSVKLIHRIAENWDWRKFKPPVVALALEGFEIIDGQHTAIGAATRGIPKIPVVVVEATAMEDRARAFIGHNKDRLQVSAVQLHHAAAAAGDEDAVTVAQVCARAGARVVRGAYGGYRWQPGDTVAVGAIQAIVGRRGAQRARELLQGLVSAGLAPVGAADLKAAELLFFGDEFRNELEPLPEGAADLAEAIRRLPDAGMREARELSALRCIPLWKAQAAIWFKKTRKRRRAMS